MLNQSGVLYVSARRRQIIPQAVDDTQERGWRYGGYSEYFKDPSEHQELVEESFKEAVRELIKEQAKEQQKFNQLVNHASNTFFKAKTVFPFSFLPSNITIDSEKITIQTSNLFSSGELRSIPIKNVSHVYLESGPIFATLFIIDQGIMDGATSVEVTHLKKEEAKRARRIIQGLMIAHKEGVDVLKLQDAEIVRKLEEIGRLQ